MTAISVDPKLLSQTESEDEPREKKSSLFSKVKKCAGFAASCAEVVVPIALLNNLTDD